MTKELDYGVNIITKMFTADSEPTIAKLDIYVYPMPIEAVPELSKDVMNFIADWFSSKDMTSGERIYFPPAESSLN